VQASSSGLTWLLAVQYDPTIEELKTKTIKHGGKALQLEILDTAGQEQYSQLREHFITTGHVSHESVQRR
jgi:GTPase SAR1 family protein